jgi:tetratricopeptide (TPR) repeat protein
MKKNITNNPPENKITEIVLLFNKGLLVKTNNKIEHLIKEYSKSFFLWNILGAVSARLNKLNKAEKCFETSIKINPSFIDGHYNLAKTQKELGKLEQSIKSYLITIKLKPDFVNAYNNLANIQKKLGQYSSAIKNYKSAIKLKSDYVEAYFNLGNTMKEIGNYTEAMSNYIKAIKLKPSYAEAYNEIGGAQNDMGKQAEAIKSFLKAIEINPNHSQSYNNYTDSKKIKNDDSIIPNLKKILSKKNLSEKDKMHFAFAMGKVQLDIGNFNSGFKYLEIGNSIKKKRLNYKIEDSIDTFSKIKNYFNKFKFNNKIINSSTNTKPIFILGMPRSGTSLVEQIISSHSKVYGAGELEFLEKAIYSTNWESNKTQDEDIKKIREQYLLKINLISKLPYITDKMPLNFQWIGFIVNAFPEAKIIHLNRDPMAVCWSNYKINFATNGMGFSFNLVDIAKYYKLYEDLINFWNLKFSKNIYNLNYENLTHNQEIETRKLLNYLGLDWEDAVLNFYKNKRVVKTASNAQIRKNIYQGSSEEWKKFEKWLQPIKKNLK